MRFLRIARAVLLPLGLAALAVVGIIEVSDTPPKAPAPAFVDVPTPASRESSVRTALSEATSNSLYADYAPQQQVVNGWAARDLLAVVAYQGSDLAASTEAMSQNVREFGVASTANDPDYRQLNLVLLILIAIAWIGAWSVVPAAAVRVAVATSPTNTVDAEPQTAPAAPPAEPIAVPPDALERPPVDESRLS